MNLQAIREDLLAKHALLVAAASDPEAYVEKWEALRLTLRAEREKVRNERGDQRACRDVLVSNCEVVAEQGARLEREFHRWAFGFLYDVMTWTPPDIGFDGAAFGRENCKNALSTLREALEFATTSEPELMTLRWMVENAGFAVMPIDFLKTLKERAGK